jgi:hypothetical protein
MSKKCLCHGIYYDLVEKRHVDYENLGMIGDYGLATTHTRGTKLPNPIVEEMDTVGVMT